MEVLLESAIRSSIIAASFGLVLAALRISSAATRYRWWAALLIVMLTLPIVTAWGLRWPLPITLPGTGTVVAVSEIPRQSIGVGEDGVQVQPRRAASPPASTWARWASAVYLAGLFWFVSRLLVGTWSARTLAAQATIVDGRLTNSRCATPVTIGFLRPHVVLPAAWQTWPPETLRAILAHEGEHVRRRDTVFLWLALLNRAVFWFHPLAWWLQRHLARLAEEACDTAVVAAGNDPVTYCRALLQCAEAAAVSGGRVSGVAMTMPGSALPRRVRTILSATHGQSASRRRLACAAFLSVGSAVVCVAAAPTMQAQAPAARDAVSAAEVVHPRNQDPPVLSVVKPHRDSASRSALAVPLNGMFRATNVTVMELIAAAYGGYLPLDAAHLLGLPSWAKTERFDVEARQEVTAPGEDRMDDDAVFAAFAMVRGVLAERFGVRAHEESRREAVYALVLAGAAKLKPTTRDCEAIAKAGPFADPPPGVDPESWTPCGIRHRPGELIATGGTMEQLTQRLAEGGVGRPVVDRTGLRGHYDFTVRWTPFQGTDVSRDGIDSGPSIFAALPEQLGLKLQSDRAPVRVLVIDRVTRPTAN